MYEYIVKNETILITKKIIFNLLFFNLKTLHILLLIYFNHHFDI